MSRKLKTASKWSAKGPVGQALRKEMIDNDYIKRGVTAGEVWKNNPMYHRHYPLENFRPNYNKMKKRIKDEQELEKSSNALDELNNAFDGKIFLFFNET